MKLWSLQRTEKFKARTREDPKSPSYISPWGMYGYVLRADTSNRARRIAAKDSKEKEWLDEGLISCVEITSEGEEGIILRSELS